MRSLICLLLIAINPLAASESPFELGLSSYEGGDYQAAITAFETQIEANETGAARHNLALAYYQLGQPAEAAWQLERALRLAPRETTYRYKLALLRGELGLSPGKPDRWTLLSQALSPSAWVALLTGSFWIFLAALLLPYFAGSPRRLPGKAVLILSCLGLILSALALFPQRGLAQRGICLTQDPAPLHAAPAAAAPQTGTARPGERAQPLEHHNAYVKIRTEGGAEGWIKEKYFRPIQP
ncbi:MAG: SH3 domain-containing protein [Opitutales bacterium]